MQVTFAVGGVGEYIDNTTLTRGHDHCTAETAADSSEHQRCRIGSDFTVTTNAVVVNTASPQAVANAVHYLVMNETLRYELGQAGKQTVRSYFHVDRQMEQYREFYVDLVKQYRTYVRSKN